MVYFANLCVNLRDCSCPAGRDHVSAPPLDFLDLDEISSFLNWKRQWGTIHQERHSWMVTDEQCCRSRGVFGMFRAIVLILVLAGAMVVLAGCGKKMPPIPRKHAPFSSQIQDACQTEKWAREFSACQRRRFTPIRKAMVCLK